MPNSSHAEFDEDHTSPILDLSGNSPRSDTDQKYTYNFEDINALSCQLRIPWEASKDIPFSTSVTYLGLVWDLGLRVVTLSESKCSKYLLAINEWSKSRTHSLNEVQKLHGKLLHASLVIPAGRAYLIHLEAMLGIFSDSPFKPRMPPHGCIEDLLWWSSILSNPPQPIHIPAPCFIHDFAAFSDASSGVGVGIIIGEQWQAWTLHPGWNSDGWDIGWAESVGFELLVQHIVSSGASNIHFKVFRDNRGVVEGWWNRHSRNKLTNDTFKRIHSLMDEADCTVITRYIPSGKNPADGPSHGLYPPSHLRLPVVLIPHALQPFICNVPKDCLPPHSSPPLQQPFPVRSGSPFNRNPAKWQCLRTDCLS